MSMLNVRMLVCAKNFADSCCAPFASARPLIVGQHKDAKRKTNCRTKCHFLLSNCPNSDDLLGIQYNPVGTFFFFSRTRLTCHLTRAASTPTSARRSNSHSDVAQASHAFSVPPASCRRNREAIAQERSNHSPIRLTTMPLPSGTLAARYTQTRRARPVALRTARRRPNSQPRRLRYDTKIRIAAANKFVLFKLDWEPIVWVAFVGRDTRI